MAQPRMRATQTTCQTPQSRTLLWGSALFTVTLIAYAPALSGGFLWDDDFYVSDNKAVTQSGYFGKIWSDYRASPQYYPLVFTSYWIEYRLWGLHTLGYHIVNVLLHVGSAIVLGRLLVRLGIPGAWLAATIFALHPVQVESVAWITERKNVLSGLFYFLSLAAYARFAALDQTDPHTTRCWRWYAAAVVLFVFALLSKTVTATLPAVILLVVWWRHGKVAKQDLLALVPMFLIGIGMGLMTVWMEHHHVGAKGGDWNLTIIERCLVAGRAPWFYAWKLICPIGLMFVYPRWTPDANAAWQYVFPFALLVAFAVLYILRGRIGRGPLVAAICFVGTLFPALGFLNVFPHRFSFVADHFQYLASVFLFVLLAATLSRAAKALSHRSRATAACLIAVLLGGLTFRQSFVYRDMGMLWSDAIAKNPSAWMAHGNLGDWLSSQNREDEAIESYLASLRLRPVEAQIHYNLGLVLQKRGRYDEAEKHYAEAARLKPDYTDAHINLGSLLMRRHLPDKAIACYREALRIAPRSALAHYDLANVLVSLGSVEEGRAHFHKAVQIQPDYWEAWVNDAGAAWMQGHADEAIEMYRDILRRNPTLVQALVNLGSILIERGDIGEGVVHLRRAVQLQPNDADARFRLAKALETARQTDEAISELREVLKRQPNHAGAVQSLNHLLAGRGG